MLENTASIYLVDEKYFKSDKRLKKEELISKSKVPVIKETRINNVLDELRKRGAHLISYPNVLRSMEGRGTDPENTFEEYNEDRFKN